MGEQRQGLHILVVGMAWPPETFLARLLCGLLDRGVAVTLVSARRPDAAWLIRRGFHWLPSIHLKGWPVRHLAWFGRNAARRWDLIYFPWNSAAIGHLPLFDLGLPAVISSRGSQVNIAPHNPRRAEIRAGLRSTFEKAAAVHCVSEAILTESQNFGLDPSKAVVIHPAVDVEFFCPPSERRETDDVFHVISTGSLIWVKGYEYALSAVRRLKDQGVPVKYTIIGDGPERQRVRYTIQDLGLEEQVTLSGRQPPEEVRNALQQADAFLLSSLSEGISNAVLEAMSCGLPVVTTDCGGMREAVTDGVEGFVVPVRDLDAITVSLSALWRSPERRCEQGKAGRDRVLRDFRSDHQIDEFIALSYRALGRCG